MQWLDEMEQHEDIAVRGGVKLAREYVQSLQKEKRKKPADFYLQQALAVVWGLLITGF